MSTFLLLLNAEKSIGEALEFQDMCREWHEEVPDYSEFEDGNFVFRWSTGGRKTLDAGDTLLLVRVGDPKVIGESQRGIVAYGVAEDSGFQDLHWDADRAEQGDLANYVYFCGRALSQNPIITISELEELFPGPKWAPQGGGARVPQEIADRLIPLIETRVGLDWTPRAIVTETDTRQEVSGAELELVKELSARRLLPILAPGITAAYGHILAKVRKHQTAFRKLLIEARQEIGREPTCEVCGFAVLKLLDAAHIVPDSEGGESSVANGALLCATHHRALDLGLIALEGDWPNRVTRVIADDGAFSTVSD